MKKVLSVLLAVIMLVSVFGVSFTAFAETKNGFVRENGAVYYYVNGTKASKRWVKWNNNLYYVDAFGEVVANRAYYIEKNGSYYYFNSKGVMQNNGLIKITKKNSFGEKCTFCYYANSNGRLYEGWKTVNGYKYYFCPYSLCNGAFEIKSKVYTFRKNSTLIEGTGWVKFKAQQKYYDLSRNLKSYDYYIRYYVVKGVAKTGLQKINGKWYYFITEGENVDGYNLKGVMCHSGGRKIQVGSTERIYVFEDNGAITKRTGWMSFTSGDGVRSGKYYVTKGGIAKTGWSKIGGNYYYFDDYNGQMATGAYSIYNKKTGTSKVYYFNKNGTWAKDKKGFVKIEEIGLSGASGEPYAYSKGTYYCYVVNGVCKTGWTKINGNYYYFNDSGEMATGLYRNYSNNYNSPTIYLFRANGVWRNTKTGWYKENNNIYYFVKGVAKKGWTKINGNYYYFDKDCHLKTGVTHIEGKNGSVKTYLLRSNGVWANTKTGWYTDGYSTYYFVNGVAKTGWKKINDKTYYFHEYGFMYKNGTYTINDKEYTFAKNGVLIR